MLMKQNDKSIESFPSVLSTTVSLHWIAGIINKSDYLKIVRVKSVESIKI